MSLCKNSIFGGSPIKYQNIRNMKYQNIPSLFLLSLILWVSYSSCRTDLEAKEMTTNMSNYIYAYTSNSISKADPIRIQLTSPIGKDLVGTEVDKSIFSFKPSISGTAQWQDEQTIVFQPKENLHLLKLDLSDLDAVCNFATNFIKKYGLGMIKKIEIPFMI